VRGVALGGADGQPLACFGELGLTGELRSVAHADRRLAEAAKFGLQPVLGPGSHRTLRAAIAGALGTAIDRQTLAA
jgi:DNA repair protein RadA/Sms